MASLESYDHKGKVAGQQTFGFRTRCFFIIGLTASLCASNASACNGVIDSDLLSVNVQKLTGLSAQQLILMPSVQNYYVNGQLKAKFGKTVRPCAGPTCNQVPVSNRLLGEMSIAQDNSLGESLTTISAEYMEADSFSGDLSRPVDMFFEQFSEQPNLRPPIL